jgi:TRAP transporter TAXI family solute receptor
MHAGLRETLISLREFLLTFAPFLLLAAGLVYIAYVLLDPTPPKRLTLATGQAQGAYAQFGARYAQLLRDKGVEVRLRPTAGAAENLALLRDPGGEVDVAFVQGGADATLARGDPDAAAPDDLVSLGSLFHEPVWIFYRTDSAERLAKAPEITAIGQLAGGRVNIGAPGSGVPNLMARLLEANALEPTQLTLLEETQTPAVVALLEGRADAVVFASAPESLIVQMLLRTPGIRLFDFAQAEAYTRRLPFLDAVTLPRGVVDLAKDLPPKDVRLVAPTATLLARKGTHPALVQLLVQAASEVHGNAGWFQKKGDFPSRRNPERPLSPEAQRFYDRGPPVLQRFMTFWVANLVDRMWPAILAIVAALLPLSRILPPLYDFRMRSRVFRWYRQLRAVEAAIGKRPNRELLVELEELEKRVEKVTVPLSYAEELYALRQHIHMVAERLIDPAPLVAAATPAAR